MAKHRRRANATKKQQQQQQMICVPKSCQQPRSHASSKPRIDFSLFFSSESSSSSSLLNSSSHSVRCHREGGSRLDLLSGKDNLSSITTTSMDRCCQDLLSKHDVMPKFSLVQCNMSQDGGKEGTSLDSIGMTSAETESRNEVLVDVCNNRINVQNKNSDAAELLCSPNKSTSQVTECSDVQATPEAIVWARTAHQMWWPAKILEGRSAPVSTNDQGADGHVLVQYCGNHDRAWVDPVDLSEFDECFEERSSNPLEDFQDALKQALHEKEGSDFCIQMHSGPDRPKNSTQHEQSVAQSNKWIESSSSREEDDWREQGRGKRKRKPKLHFDEVNFSKTSMRKMRRFRIMRFLGLTAPIGSPFSHASGARLSVEGHVTEGSQVQSRRL